MLLKPILPACHPKIMKAYNQNCFIVSCKADELQLDCDGDKCLDYRFVCNGVADCRNETDEKNCGEYTSTCE